MRSMLDVCCVVDKNNGSFMCPLQNVEVKASIDGTVAEVTLLQHFVNTGKRSIEALYTFPLIHNAQVTGFKAQIGENQLVGTFKEKDEAFREYNEAVSKGDSAYLLESHRPDIFQISLGNIAVGEKVTISVTYIEEIKIVDSELRWIFPSVLAPRYIPGKVSDKKTGTGIAFPTDRVPDADYITLPIGEGNFTLMMSVALKGISDIKKISSSSHPIEITMEKDSYIITFARETELLDSDFVLSALLEEIQRSSLIISKGVKSGMNSSFDASIDDRCESAASAHNGCKGTEEVFGEAKLVIDIEEYEEKHKNYQYVFMIDISGSMTGEKLEQAKRALRISLRNLVKGDQFNIVAFESSFQCFSENLAGYSQESLTQADKWIEKLQSMGGTEIYNPLDFVLQKLNESTDNQECLGKVVFLFTDGQVGNEKEIIRLVSEHSQLSNMFYLYPFGIDTAINKYFIDSLAEVGNGMPEYIYPGERIEEKVIRQFSRIHQPFIENPQIIGKDGSFLETMPRLPKRLYNSEIYHFTVRVEKPEILDEITLAGSIKGNVVKETFKVSGIGDYRLMSLKWAKEKIKYLEAHLNSGNPRRDELMREEIINLSIKYKLLSTLTSLVAVYNRIDKQTGFPETIVVPVAKPRGWDMFDELSHIQYSRSTSFMVNERSTSSSYKKAECNGVIPVFLRKASASKRARKAEIAEARDSCSEVSFCNKYNDVSFEIHEDINCESSGDIDKISDLILRTAEKQNADGNFGHEKEASRKTSFYIIGMLLLKDKWKPYCIQIMKAGNALMATDTQNEHTKDFDMQVDTLLKAAAVSLIKKMKLYECNKNEIQKYLDEITVKLPNEEMNVFNEFKLGNLQPMIDYIRYRVLSNFEYKCLKNINTKEFARLLLSEVLL